MWERALPAGLARALALSMLALAAAGCGGTKLLKNPAPAPALPVIAESKDARIAATVEAVIVRNGPGSWAKDASWDEYLVQVRNASDQPMRVTGIAIWDSLGTRLEPRAERADLVEASEQSERRYKDRGLTVEAGSGSPWLVAGAIGTTAVVAGAAMASSAASGAGMLAGTAAGAAVIGALAWGGIGLAWYGIARAANHREVNAEIRRRHAVLPATLAGGQGTRFHVFFPYAPSPSRLAIAYEDSGGGDHRLDLDMPLLRGLHLGAAPAALVPPRPSQAVAVADVSGPLAVILDGGAGTLTYLYRDSAGANPQEVRLASSGARRQSFSDGTEYRDLRELIAFRDLAFDPPLPLAMPALQVGRAWTHAGNVTMRSAIATARIESEFRAVGVDERDTPAGRISTIRVEELRWMHDASYRITHWIHPATLALVASQATTVVRGASGRIGHGTFIAPALDYSLELGSIR